MVLDSIVNDREYDVLEPELIADWRVHYGHACAHVKDAAVLRRCAGGSKRAAAAQDPDAAAEMEELERRLTPASIGARLGTV